MVPQKSLSLVETMSIKMQYPWRVPMTANRHQLLLSGTHHGFHSARRRNVTGIIHED